jgi:hypothetical protein
LSPVVFRYRGHTFKFYANEGNPREPAHIHVVKDGRDVKLWLWPDVTVAYNDGVDERTVRDLIVVVRERREEIERAWNEFFGGTN